MQNAETVLGVLREQHSRQRSLESRILGNGSVRFGGRPHGKGPAQQAPRRAADPAVKVNGVWRYVYRAIDQHGQVIDVLLTGRRDAAAARRFFTRVLRTLKVIPNEMVTDAAPVYPAVIDELVPAAWHHVEQYANNPIEADHGQLKRRPRPMCGLRTDRTAPVVIAGHAYLQSLRRAHYELETDTCLHFGSPWRSLNSPAQSDAYLSGVSASAVLVTQQLRRHIIGLLELRYSRRTHAAWGRFRGEQGLDMLAMHRHRVDLTVGVAREPGDHRLGYPIEYGFDHHWGDLLLTGKGALFAWVAGSSAAQQAMSSQKARTNTSSLR